MPFVVESGSKQYIVEVGQQFAVDKLTTAVAGDFLDFPSIFSFGADKGKKTLKVRVVGHAQAKKQRIVKYRSKSNYHVQSGFRAKMTVLEVVNESLPLEETVKTEVKKTAEVKEKETKEKPAAKKTSQVKKPTAKKTVKAS